MKLYGVTEFAQALGWSRQRLAVYHKRGLLPEPVARLHCGSIWTEEQVMEYRRVAELVKLNRAIKET